MKNPILFFIVLAVLLSSCLNAYALDKQYKQETMATHFFDCPKDVAIINADALFTEACELLGISVLSCKCDIKVFMHPKDFEKVYFILTNEKFPEGQVKSFYSPTEKTIYIVLTDYNESVLTHEITHAIIDAYFVVEPTMQINEILCGYAQYKLSHKKDR